jgi:hypothetical protein
MNQRIEKLIEQCTVQEFSDCTGGFETFDKEKFAELIIRDCMDVVDGYTKGRTFETHYDAVAQIEALFEIKHNRVEE